MILVIRISGMVNLNKETHEALYRLRLRRKYASVLLKPSTENLKLLRKLRNYIAYGDIDNETLSLLIQKRALPKLKSKKIEPEKIIAQLEKKDASHLDIKPFFRLHPPRGGIDAKKHFGVTKKAVLGDNKEGINALVRRML